MCVCVFFFLFEVIKNRSSPRFWMHDPKLTDMDRFVCIESFWDVFVTNGKGRDTI